MIEGEAKKKAQLSDKDNTHISISELLGKYIGRELEFQNVKITANEIHLIFQPFTRLPPAQVPKKPSVKEISALPRLEFEPPVHKYPGKIVEVRIGASKSEGGTRGSTVKLGGQQVLHFCSFEGVLPNGPVISLDLFDAPVPLPKPVKENLKEVLEDPAEWAKLYVEKWGARMVSLHLVSTDPFVKDRSPSEAAKTVEDVLQAVDVPILVGGSGNPEKDPAVFEKVCEVAEGERILINSATLDNDYKRIGRAVKRHGHAVVAFSAMDVNNAKQLNKKLLDPEVGLSREDIVMDPNTGALGYGLEYGFTVFERLRLAALNGDKDCNMPIMSGSTNAWGARESYKKKPELGPVELRGPLWETVTALTMLLAGADLILLMHPLSYKTLNTIIDSMMSLKQTEPLPYKEWVSMKG
ncbi:MAG: CO dehydrogenase/acetyl-CoA synthase subunit delta [Candidatus Bathyarchaeia archaeon]